MVGVQYRHVEICWNWWRGQSRKYNTWIRTGHKLQRQSISQARMPRRRHCMNAWALGFPHGYWYLLMKAPGLTPATKTHQMKRSSPTKSIRVQLRFHLVFTSNFGTWIPNPSTLARFHDLTLMTEERWATCKASLDVISRLLPCMCKCVPNKTSGCPSGCKRTQELLNSQDHLRESTFANIHVAGPFLSWTSCISPTQVAGLTLINIDQYWSIICILQRRVKTAVDFKIMIHHYYCHKFGQPFSRCHVYFGVGKSNLTWRLRPTALKTEVQALPTKNGM